MSETNGLDGGTNAGQQESAIQFKEAQFYTLKKISPDTPNAPQNLATFDPLDPGTAQSLVHLIVGLMPPNKTKVWSGKMYVSGALADVVAYRD
jgi:hypothetical protein